MKPVVPDRYDRHDMNAPFRWGLRPYFELSYKECLTAWYHHFTKRIPVFAFGTWIGSKVVWAIEDRIGEDRMVKERMSLMLLSGFAALFISLSRNKVISFVKAPVYAFSAAFSVIWLLDSMLIGKGGFDAVWNPLHLHLPASVVSVFVGDPFNGELVVGPLKFATINALNVATSSLFEIGRETQNLASRLSDLTRKAPSTTQEHLDSYITSIDRRMTRLEEEALEKEGFFAQGTPTARKRAIDAEKERMEAIDAYEHSWLNPYRYLGGNHETRLSLNTLEMVSTLFGEERLASVTNPLHVPKTTKEIIFGNLNDGIELATSADYVEKVRLQLESNASADKPELLGVASENGFFRREHIRAKNLAEAATIDPIGFILTPLVSLISTISEWHLFRGDYAFDDYTGRVSHSTLWKQSEQERSETSTSSIHPPSPFSPSGETHLSEHDLPKPYDLPPLLPPEAVERQQARIIASKARIFSIDDTTSNISKLVNEDLPVALTQTSDAIAIGVADAGELISEAGNALSSALFQESSIGEKSSSEALESTLLENPSRGLTMKEVLYAASRSDLAETLSGKYIPEDEYFRRIKASVDHGARKMLPAGMTSEERLMNFLENIGGRDFEEPTERVLKHKIPRHYARDRRYRSVPIVGESRKNAFKAFAFDMKHAISARIEFLKRAFTDTSTSYPSLVSRSGPSSTVAESLSDPSPSSSSSYSSYDSSSSMRAREREERLADAEARKTRAEERFERLFAAPARNWFAEMKSRFPSSSPTNDK